MDLMRCTIIGDTIETALQLGCTTISEQGSSRSGKTYNTLLWLIVYTYNHKDTKVSVVRATLPALKGSVLMDFKDIMTKLGIWNENSFNKTELIYTFPNKSVFEFFSCDSEQKLRGRKRDILFVNEANELTQIMWQQLKMRTTKFAILDYNPSFSDDHWICSVNKEEKT
jgi:Phage terminase large subunit.